MPGQSTKLESPFAVEPYLCTGSYDEYRRFLELYRALDRELAWKLARRAAAHGDEDIREAGEDFLESLEPTETSGEPRHDRM